ETEPSSGDTNDLWVKESTGQLHRYDGDSWELFQDEDIAAALDAAADAQSTADGKIQVFRQSTTPTAEAVGDLWVDEGNDNQLKRWDGDDWVPFLFGTGAIEPNSLVASNVIATGTITGSLIDAQAITTDKIAAGAITAESGILAEASVVDANIQNLAANKIQAGTIGADLVLSGNIKTAAAGARVEINSGGISALNQSGAEAV